MTKFSRLVMLGDKINAVVQKERRGYSLYSNTYFYEDICKNLDELAAALDELRERMEGEGR